MGIYRDSVGGTYDRLPTRKPVPKAKPTKKKTDKPRRRKGGSSERKYALYRARTGRPNGPGQPGNKSGANKLRRKPS